jgi:hypothetical protein
LKILCDVKPSENRPLATARIKHNMAQTFDLDDINNYSGDDQAKNVFIKKFTVSGVFPIEDRIVWNCVYNDYLTYKIGLYKFAVIRGCNFAARGFHNRECILPPINRICNDGDRIIVDPQNSLNILRNNWTDKNQVSSWCKIKLANNNLLKNNIATTSKVFMGQLNFFFNLLTIPKDSIFVQVGFASITTRSIFIDKKFRTQNIIRCKEDKESFQRLISFVPIRIIVPTPILVAGFDIFNKPFIFYDAPRNNDDSIKKFISHENFDQVEKIVLIDFDSSQCLLDI